MLIRAKYVLWKAGEKPIEDGVVFVRGQRITAVGTFRNFSNASRKQILDLGEVVLLPGLINTHCHLNYTAMAGKIPPPRSFTHWIQQFSPLKRASSPEGLASAVSEGLRQLQLSGTTTVCDIASDIGAAGLTKQAFHRNFEAVAASPLRVWSCLEHYDLDKASSSEQWVNSVLQFARAHPRSRGGYGLSPHAPYTTSAALFKLMASRASRLRMPLTTHIAESEDEWEMLMRGRGPLFEMGKRFGSDVSHCGKTTPVQWLASLGVLGPRTIGVHMNYLTPNNDFDTVARSGMSVVHCPRSHEYFRHRRFPLERLLKLGVNICLGTDSAASISSACHSDPAHAGEESPSLDMFFEMRTLHRHHPKLSPREILRMATLNGARALGQETNVGSIEPGKFADLIAIPASESPQEAPEAILDFKGPVLFSMAVGRTELK